MPQPNTLAGWCSSPIFRALSTWRLGRSVPRPRKLRRASTGREVGNVWNAASVSASLLFPGYPYLFAPTIHDGVCHRISDRFVAHRPLKLVNPVFILLIEFALHGIGNFRAGNRASRS
jgi:hypothetical protein